MLLEDGHCLREQALEVCQTMNHQHNNGFHATSLETLRQMVAAGNGITLLPALAVNKNPSIVVKPITKQKAFRIVGMLWRKQSIRTKCCGVIAELVIQHFKKCLFTSKSSCFL